MAICIPQSDVSFETPGEKMLFSHLKQLPDSCLVYYEMMVGERDQRPDFVVIDTERGVTIYEVKDWGKSTVKKVTPRMFEIVTHHNQTVKKMNPELKIKQYLENVREQLATQEALCDSRGKLIFPIRSYVVFPNFTHEEFQSIGLQSVINPQTVIFKENLKQSGKFLEIYNNGQAKLDRRLTPKELSAIRIGLFPELTIPGGEQWFASAQPDRPVVMENETEEFGLDINQEQMAKSLGAGPRFLHGIAGTGKTLIILFHAKMTSANRLALGEQPKILILCWNISLAQYMRHAYQTLNIPNAGEVEIMHFSAFARKLIKATPGVRFPHPDSKDFDSELTKALNKARNFPKYDIVYVDEAQDFQKEWIKMIYDHLLKGEPDQRNLIIAGDYAQHIYKYRDFAKASGFTWKSLGINMVGGRTKILKKIYRNSARVWSFAAAFIGNIQEYYKDDEETKIEFAPKKGYDPQLISCASVEEQLDRAVEIVSRLSEHGYSPRNAMILYRSARYQGYPLIEKLMAKLDEKKIPYQWITEDTETKATFQWQDESVKISTVHSAKGMDAPVVIILGAESFKKSENDLEDEEKLLYVALTRAREYLAVLYTGDGDLIPKLTNAMNLYKRFYQRIKALEDYAKRSFSS